jgi:hypothetical protein
MADATFDFEVFSAPGRYNGFGPFTTEHLDEMVRNFGALREYIRPALKAGHSSNQILAGQADGDPALGWCVGLRRAGNKLIGTFKGVPEKFAALIRKGRYLRGSSEIVMDWAQSPDEANLKTGVTGKVLTGFAVLGADMPAVKNLDDLADFLGAAAPLHFADVAPSTVRAEAPLLLSHYAPGSLLDLDECVRRAVTAVLASREYTRGKTTEESTPGSFAPSGNSGAVYVTHDGHQYEARRHHADVQIIRDGKHMFDAVWSASEDAFVDDPPEDALIPIGAFDALADALRQAQAKAPAAMSIGSHACNPPNAATAAQEHNMADAPTTDTALLAKFDDLEAKLTQLVTERDADKAAHAAALAERDAKIAKLSEDTAKAREREAAAETRSRKLDAEAWVAKFSQAGNLRILPGAPRALATVLRDRLTALDATIAPTELVGCFSDHETPVWLRLADVFERFVSAMPDHKVMLSTVTTAAPVTGDDPAEAFIQLKAKEQGRNPKDPTVRAELTRLFASEHPDVIKAAYARS